MKKFLAKGALSLFVLFALMSTPSYVLAQTTTAPSTEPATLAGEIATLRAQLDTLMRQLQDILAQRGTQAPVSIISINQNFLCFNYYRTLGVGAYGDDVTNLQKFLGISTTGFFGTSTAQALTTFQINNGIITTATTGGTLGPLTRAYFINRCRIITPTASSSIPINGGNPGDNPLCKSWFDGCNTCSRQVPGGTPLCTLMACVYGNTATPYCSNFFTSTGTSSLSINSFSGPTQLTVGQQGTWSMNVTDSSNGTLTYKMNWGDTFNDAADILNAIANNTAYLQASSTMTLTHTYTQPGVYTIAFYILSSSGTTAQTTATVVVTDESTTGSSTGPTICPMYVIQCPFGQHDQVGNNCSHACVPNSSPIILPTSTLPTICPMIAMQCPTGQHDTVDNNCNHSCAPNAWPSPVILSGGACMGASGTYSSGTTLDGQIITGGPFTYTMTWPQYTCTNSLWVCTNYCGANQGVSYNYSNGTLSPVNQSSSTTCPYNGQTYANGTTMSLDVTKIPGYTGTQADGRVVTSVVMVCTTIPEYQCRNGDWYKISGCPDLPNMVAAKPVIYLYPTSTEEVSVQLKYKGTLTSTYPTYNAGIQGWRVIAQPDGTLTNLEDNKQYNYLFWEGTYPLTIDQSYGFVIKGSDTKDFLQTTLAKMGLTAKEYNEFIVYWLPKMEHNPYNFIQFVGDAYTQSAPLTITPTPDSVLRVFMAYKPLDQYEAVTPQQIQPFARKGFSVVEWGGTELSQ